MGYFLIIPGNETYTARWKDEYGQKHETTLPSAKKRGAVLEVNNLGESLEFNIKSSSDLPAEFDAVSIVGHLQQRLIFTAKATLKPGKTAHGTISIDGVPPGIA